MVGVVDSAHGITLTDSIDAAAPDERVALVGVAPDGHRVALSYGALRQRIAQAADRLRTSGLPPGCAIGMGGGNTLDAVVATYGAWRAGLAVVPVNPRVAAPVLQHMLEAAGVAAVADDTLRPGTEPLPGFDLHTLAPRGAAGWPAQPAAAHPGRALVMFTSGSTGLPKAVAIEHAGYCWALSQFQFVRPLVEGRSGIVAAPLHHMNGQFHLLQMLSCGATVVLMESFDAQAWGRCIEAEHVVRVTGVPTMLALLLREIDAGARFDFSNVLSVSMGSAPFSPELHRRACAVFPHAVVGNGWGTTETGPAAFGLHPRGLPTPVLSIGHPIGGAEVKLVDGPHADEGTLWLRTPMTLRGYLNDSEASARSVVDGWFVTGDRMRRDADGFFYFLGRADDRLQVGGENVYPLEVERLLESHPAVRQAAVVALPDGLKHEVPVAFVVLGPEADAQTRSDPAAMASALKAHCLAHGPAYAHPRHIAVLDALPLSAANKVDRRLLSSWAQQRFVAR
jgi:acyl-CoA synthetase (AMP-forming)/AMP-acid ligase II